MKPSKPVLFNCPESQRLADLTSIAGDLHQAAQFCDIVINEYDDLGTADSHNALLDALCVAALVRYMRAFSKDIRSSLPDDIVPAECRDQHKRFKAMRDKWIAHSENQFEETYIKLVLEPNEDGKRGVRSITTEHHRVISMSPLQFKQLRDLARVVEDNVAQLLREERSRVLEFARNLDPEQFYEQTDPPRRTLGVADPTQRRKKWT